MVRASVSVSFLRSLTILLSALSVGLSAQCLDQEYMPATLNVRADPGGMLLTVQKGGRLEQIDVAVFGGGGFQCRVHSVPAGGPSGGTNDNVLASRIGNFPAGQNTVVSLDFSSDNVFLQAGQQVLISVRGSSWEGTTGGYEGGEGYRIIPFQPGWQPTTIDYAFRMYTRPSELTYTQPVPGGLDVEVTNGPPSAFYLNMFTTDTTNASSLGTGWWGGLHIPINEFLFLSGLTFPPFQGFLDSAGGSFYSYPAGSLSGASGMTIYANVHFFAPNGTLLNVTPTVAYTFP